MEIPAIPKRRRSAPRESHPRPAPERRVKRARREGAEITRQPYRTHEPYTEHAGGRYDLDGPDAVAELKRRAYGYKNIDEDLANHERLTLSDPSRAEIFNRHLHEMTFNERQGFLGGDKVMSSTKSAEWSPTGFDWSEPLFKELFRRLVDIRSPQQRVTEEMIDELRLEPKFQKALARIDTAYPGKGLEMLRIATTLAHTFWSRVLQGVSEAPVDFQFQAIVKDSSKAKNEYVFIDKERTGVSPVAVPFSVDSWNNQQLMHPLSITFKRTADPKSTTFLGSSGHRKAVMLAIRTEGLTAALDKPIVKFFIEGLGITPSILRQLLEKNALDEFATVIHGLHLRSLQKATGSRLATVGNNVVRLKRSGGHDEDNIYDYIDGRGQQAKRAKTGHRTGHALYPANAEGRCDPDLMLPQNSSQSLRNISGLRVNAKDKWYKGEDGQWRSEKACVHDYSTGFTPLNKKHATLYSQLTGEGASQARQEITKTAGARQQALAESIPHYLHGNSAAFVGRDARKAAIQSFMSRAGAGEGVVGAGAGAVGAGAASSPRRSPEALHASFEEPDSQGAFARNLQAGFNRAEGPFGGGRARSAYLSRFSDY